MYILPSNEPDTAIVVTEGKSVTAAIKRYLVKIGKQFYFTVESEADTPKEKYELAN